MADHLLDNSLNISKKNLMCNHCMYDCKTYEHMREHYRSDFHKYNLNRVTMNLNNLTYPEYLKKKELYQKTYEANNKTNQQQSDQNNTTAIEHKCEVCRKMFASLNKLKEHLISKLHKKNEEIFNQTKSNQPDVATTANKKEKEEEQTALNDINICLFCNKKSDNLENNIIHMINTHKFEVPFIHCIKSYKGFLELLAKKIFKYGACVNCDTQKFKNYKALQNHMMDKQHTAINNEDLEEFMYKYYDKKKFFAIKEKELRKTKEFQILKIKLAANKKLKKSEEKEKAEEEDEGWETVSENEDENQEVIDTEKGKSEKKKLKQEIDEEEFDDDYEPIELPNGELLMEDGTVIGNKIYQVYYKQRLHVHKFGDLVDVVRKERLKVVKSRGIAKGRSLPKPKYYSITDSNKSSFQRINTLFKARKQVNV
jgi:pre-60S factor REI1